MEANITESYSDASALSTPSPSPTTTRSGTTRSKPLPLLPNHPLVHIEDPYHDRFVTASATLHVPSDRPPCYRVSQGGQTYYPPYTDAVPAVGDDDDVPLAYLYPYPTEAPPAYAVAVPQSYRDTLIMHVPSGSQFNVDVDTEAQDPERAYPKVRFWVRRLVATLFIAFHLVVISALVFGMVQLFKEISKL